MTSTGRVEFEGCSISSTNVSDDSLFVNSISDLDLESDSSFVVFPSCEYSNLLRDFAEKAASKDPSSSPTYGDKDLELETTTDYYNAKDQNLLTVFSSPISTEGTDEDFEEAPVDQLSPSVLAIIEREKTLKKLLAAGTLTITLKRPLIKELIPITSHTSERVLKGTTGSEKGPPVKKGKTEFEPLINLDNVRPDFTFTRDLILLGMRAKRDNKGRPKKHDFLTFDDESIFDIGSSIYTQLKRQIDECGAQNGTKAKKPKAELFIKSQNGFKKSKKSKKSENDGDNVKQWNGIFKQTTSRVGNVPSTIVKNKDILKNKPLIYPQIDISEFYEPAPAQSIQSELNGEKDNFEEAFANRIRDEISSGWNSMVEETANTFKQDWSLKNFLTPFSPTPGKVKKKISNLINDNSSPVTISKVKLKKERKIDPSKFLEIHMDESAKAKSVKEEENFHHRNFSYGSNDKAFLWETDLRATLLSSLKQ